jgi:hypothetical protein
VRTLVLAGLAGAALAGMALTGCAQGAVSALPPPPSTAPTSSTTTTPNGGGGVLQGVSAETTVPAVSMGPGRSSLSGSVGGPDGPVGGATVEVQRLVGDETATTRVTAEADGRWLLADVLGGRFRVRAWRAPDQTMASPQILFLDNGDNRTVDLTLQSFSGPAVTFAIAPNPPVVDQPANLVVSVSNRIVDDSGVGRAVPVVNGPVQLTGTGGWQVTSPNPPTTDGAGRASWQLSCQAAGPQPLGVSINNGPSQPIAVPACTG